MVSEQELQSLKGLIAVLDEQAFPGTDFYAAVNVAKKMIAEVERLRNTKSALVGAMQHVFDTAHYITDRDDEYELRERLQQVESWARRFEGVDVTQPAD